VGLFIAATVAAFCCYLPVKSYMEERAQMKQIEIAEHHKQQLLKLKEKKKETHHVDPIK
jgi:hypothetical protein